MSGIRSINTKELPLALLDDLTQLCNRRFIYNNMSGIISGDKDFAARSSVMMIDVDNFKQINDKFGHLTGDMILMQLSRMFERSVAGDGIVARYAGDEFLILLPGRDEGRAREIAGNIMRDASQLKWSAKDESFTGQGLSIGIAVCPADGKPMKDVIDCADQALYAAKNSGKNRVFSYAEVGAEIKERARLKKIIARPPLVGRAKELESLKEHYKVCCSGARRFVLIKGPAGVGKTRILEELAAWSEKESIFFLYNRFQKEDESGPLSAVCEMARAAANALGQDRFKEIISKLTPVELSELVYVYPAAADLVRAEPVRAAQPNRASHLFSGLSKIYVAMFEGRSPVIVIDNMQFANRMAMQFILLLLGTPGISKLLIVGASREDGNALLHSFMSKDITATMEIKPFGKADTAHLIEGVLPELGRDTRIIDAVFKASKGIPLYVCDIFRQLVDRASVVYSFGRWTLKPADAGDISGMLSISAPDVTGLDAEAKEVLSTAAVMGDDVDIDTLKKLSGYNEGYVRDLLDRAVRSGLMVSRGDSGESVSFSRDSSRTAFADKMTAAKAADIHRRLVELIALVHKDDLQTQAGRLARHSDLGKDAASGRKYRELLRAISDEYALPSGSSGAAAAAPGEDYEPPDEPLSDAGSALVKDAVLNIRAAVIGALLYPAGNNMRADLEKRVYDTIGKILINDPVLAVSTSGDKIFVNGLPPKHKDVKSAVGFTLSSLLEEAGISRIVFKRGVTQDELAFFLHFLANAEEESALHEDIDAYFKEKGLTHIKACRASYGAGRAEPRGQVSPAVQDAAKASLSELLKGNILDMPVESYSDPKIADKLGLIAEALMLGQNTEKVKSIINEFSRDLTLDDGKDKGSVTEGAIKISEALLNYEKFDLLEELTTALLGRVDGSRQLQEYSYLCGWLRNEAAQLIDKGNFNQAAEIINHLRQQASEGSACTDKQRKIARESLHEIAHPRVVEALMKALRDTIKSDNGARITGVLVALGENAIDSILNVLTQEEPDNADPFDMYVMRHSMSVVLKEIGMPAKDALVKMLLSDGRSHVKGNAIEMLGYLGGGELTAILAPFIHDASSMVRIKCVVALKKAGTAEALKILMEGFQDRDKDVRQAAGSAIAELADESFVEKLKPLLLDSRLEGLVKDTIRGIRSKKRNG